MREPFLKQKIKSKKCWSHGNVDPYCRLGSGESQDRHGFFFVIYFSSHKRFLTNPPVRNLRDTQIYNELMDSGPKTSVYRFAYARIPINIVRLCLNGRVGVRKIPSGAIFRVREITHHRGINTVDGLSSSVLYVPYDQITKIRDLKGYCRWWRIKEPGGSLGDAVTQPRDGRQEKRSKCRRINGPVEPATLRARIADERDRPSNRRDGFIVD